MNTVKQACRSTIKLKLEQIHYYRICSNFKYSENVCMIHDPMFNINDNYVIYAE